MLKVTTVYPMPHAAKFFLLEAGKTALWDVGQFFATKEAIEAVKGLLKGKKLDYIILSHSHYDHIGPLAYFRKEYPDLKVVASPKCKEIFDKESTMKRIADTCVGAAENLLGSRDKCLPFIFEGFNVDIVVETGDTLDMGGATLEFFLSPGHTICSMGMIDREDKILFPSETTGVCQDGGLIDVTPLKGVQMSIDAIDEVLKMDFEKVIIPHQGELTHYKPKEFFELARREMFSLKDIICGCGDKGMSDQEIFDYCKLHIYDERRYKERNVPYVAFLANYVPLIQTMKKEFPEHFVNQKQ